MSDPLLGNPLVRSYLRRLDEACAGLPYDQARELTEQITGHLEDALPPDAADADVKAELTRLGTPRSLAAEAAGITPARFPRLQPALRRVRRRLGRVRWWTWAVIAVLVPALGTGTGLLISMQTATPLFVTGVGWLYPVDQAHATQTSIMSAFQSVVPIRSRQRQGLELSVLNFSDWTQQVLGVDPHWEDGSFGDIQVTVETGPYMHMNGAAKHGTPIYYRAGATIPPHSYRFIHITWISDLCETKDGLSTFSNIPFRIRVGSVTRTEDIPLDEQTYGLAGPSQGKCG